MNRPATTVSTASPPARIQPAQLAPPPAVEATPEVVDLCTASENSLLRDDRVEICFLHKESGAVRQTNFSECDTARKLYVRACIANAADKETELMEVTIDGIARKIVPRDEVLFEEMVQRPIEKVLSEKEGPVSISVKHYM